MKKYIILSFLGLLCTFIVWSQEPTPVAEVISSAGDFCQSDNMQIEWTIGESITESFNDYSILLITQGLHQGYDEISKEPPFVETLDPIVLSISSTMVGGNVTGGGGAAITDRGVYIGSEPNTVITGQFIQLGTGLGPFTYTLEALTPGGNYYVVAYATNSEGTSYGDELSFCTILLPNVTTTEANEVTSNSALLGGEVVSNGGTSVLERGIYISTEPNPDLNGTKYQIGLGTGLFEEVIEDLDPATLYFVVAYATNAVGTALGNQINFETPPGSIPTSFWLDELNLVAGQDTCFSAAETITVAGNGSAVNVNSGGSLLLVAGQSIHLMDGFRVFSGANFQAWIDTNGDFCTNPKSILAISEENTTPQQTLSSDTDGMNHFKVFPNPTSGTVMIEFSEMPESDVTVEIFSMLGEVVYKTQVFGDIQCLVDLTGKPKGIYIFRVLMNDQFQIEKVIKK